MNEKSLEKCLWKNIIMKQIKSNGGIQGMSLQVRECNVCDGYEKMCDRYLEKPKKKYNWLGLYGDYLK